MSSKNFSHENYNGLRIHRWVVSPDTLSEWLIWTALWVTTLAVTSLLFGAVLDQPRNGASVTIFLSGMCVIFATDTYSRKCGPG